MARNDSILNTGMTSASFASPKEKELKQKRKEEQEEKQRKKLTLQPSADIVLDLITKHRDKVKSIEEFEVEQMVSDEHFKSEVMARKKFVQFLNLFEQEIKIALKEPE